LNYAAGNFLGTYGKDEAEWGPKVRRYSIQGKRIGPVAEPVEQLQNA
jgi:hypothetical protein